MHVNKGKIRNFPSLRKNYTLNHAVRTNETEAIMVYIMQFKCTRYSCDDLMLSVRIYIVSILFHFQCIIMHLFFCFSHLIGLLSVT